MNHDARSSLPQGETAPPLSPSENQAALSAEVRDSACGVVVDLQSTVLAYEPIKNTIDEVCW